MIFYTQSQVLHLFLEMATSKEKMSQAGMKAVETSWDETTKMTQVETSHHEQRQAKMSKKTKVA